LALWGFENLERLRRSEASFLEHEFRQRVLNLLNQVEEVDASGDAEKLAAIVQAWPTDLFQPI